MSASRTGIGIELGKRGQPGELCLGEGAQALAVLERSGLLREPAVDERGDDRDGQDRRGQDYDDNTGDSRFGAVVHVDGCGRVVEESCRRHPRSG